MVRIYSLKTILNFCFKTSLNLGVCFVIRLQISQQNIKEI